LRCDRPWRPAFTRADARQQLRSDAGGRFDLDVVAVFLGMEEHDALTGGDVHVRPGQALTAPGDPTPFDWPGMGPLSSLTIDNRGSCDVAGSPPTRRQASPSPS
jgi:hypothetical protein